MDSSAKGQIIINELFFSEPDYDLSQNLIFDSCFSKLTVTDKNINEVSSKMPLIAYIAGYCIHSVINRIKCDECKSNLTTDETIKLSII